MTKVVVRAVLAILVLGIVGVVSIVLGQLLLVPSFGAAVLLQTHLPNLSVAERSNTAIEQLGGVVCRFEAVLVFGATADRASRDWTRAGAPCPSDDARC